MILLFTHDFDACWMRCPVVTESLNTDMVKAENPEAVVATEPQGKKTPFFDFLLQNSELKTKLPRKKADELTERIITWECRGIKAHGD